MTPERLRQAENFFLAAAEMAPADRSRFLDESCGKDAELRAEVEAMLAASADTFLGEMVNGAARAVRIPAPVDEGRRIGPYRVLQEIGRGGMGAVYLAVRDDDEFHQQVALKLIGRALPDEYTRRRFIRERQLLANLQHPGIARLLDGGTTADGLPYFALEYVEGLPVTAYCEANRLATRQRLELFRLVCAAVQYAHQKLVVHRDLKPGNILIASEGQPKLLDFGIAKLIDTGSAGELTATSRLMLTPDYASPEQVRGETAAISSDVYSLGVILFELLTGRLPHVLETRTPAEIERAICTQDPPKPSAVGNTRELAGDLDNIILTALRKEPGRRYATVEQFSEDIRRYLEGLPVLAREATIRYRAGKFLRRHRVAVAAAALVIVSLVGGTVVSAWQARRARRQAEIAERRFQQVRTLAGSFLFEIDDRLAALSGSTGARELIVKNALAYLDALAADAAGDPGLRVELARAYERIGDVQGNPYQPNLGKAQAARQSYEKAVALLENVRRQDARSRTILRPLAVAYRKLADSQVALADFSGARVNHLKSLDLAQDACGSHTGDTECNALLADAYSRAGDTVSRAGDLKTALMRYRDALKLAEQWAAAHPGKSSDAALAHNRRRVAGMLLQLGDLTGARDNFRAALEIYERLAADRSEVSAATSAALLHLSLGDLLGGPYELNLGQAESALEHYRLAIAIDERLAHGDPDNGRVMLQLVYDYLSVSSVIRQRDPAAALQFCRKALALGERLLGHSPEDNRYVRAAALARAGLGAVLKRQGALMAALQEYRRASDRQASIRSSTAGLTQEMIWVALERGDLELEMGNAGGALESFRRALAIAERNFAESPANLRRLRSLADSYEAMGRWHRAQPGRKQEALVWYQKSYSIWKDWSSNAISSVYNQRREQQAAALIASVQHR